jgi:hypothetical protein
MKIAIITANLGHFDPPSYIVPQIPIENVEIDIHRFDDNNFPPRIKAMTPRLQARIPKMFGYDMVPGYDYYIWLDGSFSILNEQTIQWYLSIIASKDIVFFKHPTRNNIKSEADFIRKKIEDKNEYLTSRYWGELIDDQLAACNKPGYEDDLLLATCSFIYKNCDSVKILLKEWWIHTSRYHIVDQLSIPFLLKTSNCKFMVIDEDIYHIPYVTYTRNQTAPYKTK